MESEKINKFKFLRHRVKRKTYVCWGRFKLCWYRVKRKVCAPWEKSKLRWRGRKYIACVLWREYISMRFRTRRKEIRAEKLEEICKMFIPSFSCFVENLKKSGVEFNVGTRKQLSRVFDEASNSLFPEEISREKLNKLKEETCDILEELDEFRWNAQYIDFSFLDYIFPNTEKILARIKDEGLEKHIVFYEHLPTSALIENFWGAVKRFLADEKYDNPDEYTENTRTKQYMSRWSFIFNRVVAKSTPSIEIRNLKIVSDSQVELNFERFARVMFSCNEFCESIDIEAMRHKQIPAGGFAKIYNRRDNEFIFYKNIFCDCTIKFKDIDCLIFEKNNFKNHTSLIHSPNVTSNPEFKHCSVRPIIRLINNKVNHLFIQNNEATDRSGLVPVKVEFLRKNRLTGLSINMSDNELDETDAKSDIKNILFDVLEEINPTDTDPNSLRWYKNFFLKLKNEAINKKDRSAELIYARQERYFDRRLSSRWEDRFIFWWGDFVSKSGISWRKPLCLLFIFQMICIALPVWYITENYELGMILAMETLNPLTTLSERFFTLSEGLPQNLLPKNPYVIPALTVFQKIFLSILLYETIKVLRRFSK